MSTHTRLKALEAEAAKKKAKKKTKAKRDEAGRFVKDEAVFRHTIIMIALIKPILFKFLSSTAVKELVVKLLEAYSKTTDNTVDDKLTALVKKNLLPEE